MTVAGPLSRGWSQPEKSWTPDLLDKIPAGGRLHLVHASGVESQLTKLPDGTWSSPFGAISTSTVHQALPGCTRAIAHGV